MTNSLQMDIIHANYMHYWLETRVYGAERFEGIEDAFTDMLEPLDIMFKADPKKAEKYVFTMLGDSLKHMNQQLVSDEE